MTNEAPAERPKGHSLRGEKRPKAASSYLPSYSALPWYRRRHTDNVGMNLQVHPRRWHIARTAGKSCHLNRCVPVRPPENWLLRLTSNHKTESTFSRRTGIRTSILHGVRSTKRTHSLFVGVSRLRRLTRFPQQSEPPEKPPMLICLFCPC